MYGGLMLIDKVLHTHKILSLLEKTKNIQQQLDILRNINRYGKGKIS